MTKTVAIELIDHAELKDGHQLVHYVHPEQIARVSAFEDDDGEQFSADDLTWGVTTVELKTGTVLRVNESAETILRFLGWTV